MRIARAGIVVFFVVALVAPPQRAAPAPSPNDDPIERQAVDYRPPVDATPLIDVFRPPATAYGAGNRGLDYGTTPGQEAHAAAAGEVVFAGQVGTSRHVVILHADGLRTSYSFLATTALRRGQHVEPGATVGTTSEQPLHFGVRTPQDEYLDPLVLLGQDRDDAGHGPQHHPAHLVADPHPERPLTETQERRHLLDSLQGLVTTTAGWLTHRATDVAADKLELLRALADTAADLSIPLPLHLAEAALDWQDQQDRCTPPQTPPPDHPAQGNHPPRIVILVGGLGSATGHTAVLDVDTETLGYDDGNVHQFSYHADQRQPYEPSDTLGDIDEQGANLARAIATLQQQHPGSPVDVIAHSQGGLVARSAITTHHAAPATLVTLGTPHQGTDLATAATNVAGSATGATTLATIGDEATRHGLTGIDPTATSIRQMGETSDFIRHLPEEGWPDDTFVVSIAARGDPVVPNHHSHLEEPPAHNGVVEPGGGTSLADHVRLPGSAEATAEIARALARQPPTCRTLPQALLDRATGWNRSNGEDLLGAALALGGLAAEAGNPAATYSKTAGRR